MKYVKSYSWSCALWFDIFIVFQNVISIIIDVFSIVYLRFKNYRNTNAVFISDNIVSFSFLTKKNVKVKLTELFADGFWSFSCSSRYPSIPVFWIAINYTPKNFHLNPLFNKTLCKLPPGLVQLCLSSSVRSASGPAHTLPVAVPSAFRSPLP